MKYGFIGCGNMGSAIVAGLCHVTKDIMVSDRSGKARAFAQTLSIEYGTNAQIASQCDRIFLAVKPQMMEGVLQGIQSILQTRKPILISMAAGLTISRLQEMAGTSLPVIRIMPNTPVAVGKGLVLHCRNELVSEDVMEDFLSDMRYCGILDAAEEKLFDAAGTVSGCTPAYFYMLIEAMADGAVACGVPRAKAMAYAAAAMSGAAEMVLQTGKHPGQLKDEVCSPGGSTIAGLRALEERGFRSAAAEAIVAACKRNGELGKLN